MHVFVDTNILLNFFHFSNEELDALANVFASQEQGSARVHLTDQVVAEFRRNREARILDALKRFKEFRRGLQLPHFMRAYEEFPGVQDIAGELQAKLGALARKSEADIAERKLPADSLIQDVFSSTEILQTTDEIYRRAKTRVDLGNPPGKESSLGDAVNWELLLDTVPNEEDLHIVTEDSDFYSSINSKRPNPYLEAEWHERKAAHLHLYRTLSSFLNQHFDGVTLSFDKEKQQLIASLNGSGSFARTHSIVGSLSAYGYFSFNEAKAMLDAAVDNDQVGWILEDDDVDELYRKAISPHVAKFTQEDHVSLVQQILTDVADGDDDSEDKEIPI